MKKGSITIFVFSVLSLVFASSTQAAVLFQENFDSYIAGTNLAGQGGWTLTSGLNVEVNHFGPFGSQGYIGADNSPASATTSKISQNINPVPTTGILSLSYDGWGNLNNKRSHSSIIGFNDFSTSDYVYMGYVNNFNTNPQRGIIFEVNGSSTREYLFLESTIPFDTVGHFEIVIDMDNDLLYGIADFNGNVQQTQNFALTSGLKNNLDSIIMYSDYRWTNSSPFTTGANFDNIVLSHTAVPEPSTYALLLSGLLGLIAYRKKFKK